MRTTDEAGTGQDRGVTELPEEPGLLGGRYRLDELIARGGSAFVYHGYDTVLRREVAVKHATAGADPADLRRAERELAALAQLDHPGLVRLYDAMADRPPYLVLEFVPGESLAERLERGPLPLPEVARLGEDVGDTLAYLHDHGLVHRDVKPANVLTDADGRPRLTDLGIAVEAGATLTGSADLIGTPRYLAPEQVEGRNISPRTDVYALGLMLLECLTGRPEYPGTAVESAVARLHRAPRVPAELPAAPAGLLRAMTALEPADRPEAAQVAAAWPVASVLAG